MKALTGIALFLCFMSAGCAAQSMTLQSANSPGGLEAPLTNADVIRMIRGGLPTKTIILAIRNHETRFNTDPTALLSLKRRGVDQTIINAMIAGDQKSPPTSVNQEPNRNLGDAFSIAALRALRAIDEETGASSLYNRPNVTDDQRKVLRIMGAEESDPREYRQTQAIVDQADAEARNSPEKEIVSLLRNLLTTKLAVNRNWRIAKIYGGSAEAADKALQRNPTFNMLSSVKGCIQDLEPALRDREFNSVPGWCNGLLDNGF